MVLGLKYGTVRVVDHDAHWGQAFESERILIAKSLDGLECQIQHIGSTAVAGLRAKPILDIAVGIPESADVDDCISRLQRLGYEYRGDAGEEGGHVLVRARGDVRTHHVHAVTLDGHQWRAYLGLRDFLRRHSWAREQYAAVKDQLALSFSGDRKAYQRGKTAFVDGLLRRARAE